MTFVPTTVTLEGKFSVSRPPHQAFPLFSPRGEEAWVPDWKPEILYPAGSEWERGLVFRTIRDGLQTIWFVGHLDRERCRVTYHRVDGGIVAVTVSVACESTGDDATEVHVSYTFVGLTQSGNETAGSRNATEFAAWMREWETMIANHLSA